MNTSILTPYVYSEVLKYYGYEHKDGKFIKSDKQQYWDYFGRLRKSDFS